MTVLNGIINVYKPKGMTSHDVVYRLRRILRIKKIGHTGTLDPDAEGVLPMCIGRGTKTADMLTAADKQYLAEVTLGSATDTQDSSGTVLKSAEVSVNQADIHNTINKFIGDINQIPPMYSAIKIGGRKLYELAREGVEIERKPRPVRITNIEVKNFDLENQRFSMIVDCTKGTYIRTLCNDIGEELGCFAHMSGLVRTKSGRFDLDSSYTLEDIESMFKRGDLMFFTTIDKVFSEYEELTIPDNLAFKMCNGVRVKCPGTVNEGNIYRIYDKNHKFLTISKAENGRFTILKTFYQD